METPRRDALASYGDGTACVHAGLPRPEPGEPFLPGPVFAAPYHLDPERGPDPELDGYGRMDNPTRRRLEDAIGALEGGDCVTFGSGMAAISALVTSVARPGDTIMIPTDGYYGTRRLAAETLEPFGIKVLRAPTAGPYPSFSGVRLVLLETPANPGLNVCDIRTLANRAHAAGALVAVDNTTATPLGQRPLDLGADIAVASGTKGLTGHSDLLLGYLCGRDPATIERVRLWRDRTGAVPGAFDAWLAHRSLGTLDLRLTRQSTNAAAVARLLAVRPDVTDLRYPGLVGDPSFEIAVDQMRRLPGIVSFTLPSAAQAVRFLRECRLIYSATSFGGLHTTADRRAQWGDDADDGLIRLSCGVEDTVDLLDDLTRALDRAAVPG
jgi:cystathionine gamma-lyase